jgi:glycosyltransferase involved in cell wall biosynthesis
MEGMPLAVVEAMLCGRVCLVTNVGGHAEWIDDNTSGFLIPAPNVSSILQTLNRALAHKNRWEAIGMQAHRSATTLYDPNTGSTLLNRIIAP